MANPRTSEETRLWGTSDNTNLDISDLVLLLGSDGTLLVRENTADGEPTKKILGSAVPAASTETTIYTVPASTNTTVEQIVITNKSGATTFNLGIAVGGGSIGAAEFLFSTTPIPANTTITLEGPFYLDATDLIRGDSASGSVVFRAEGIEWA